MKLALAQNNYHLGNFNLNAQKIIANIEQAKSAGASLVILAHQSVSGAAPQDLLCSKAFMNQQQQAIQQIAQNCHGISCVVGVQNQNGDNAVLLLKNGQSTPLRLKEGYLASNNILLVNAQDIDDLSGAIKGGLTFALAAKPFEWDKHDQLYASLSQLAMNTQSSLVFVNQVGAQTDLVFEGAAKFFDEKGQLKKELKSFEEDFALIDLEEIQQAQPLQNKPASIAKIHDALVLGIKDFFQKLGLEKALVGLSGGIDSAVVCALACKALGKDRVLGVLMPSKYSTDHSVKDALDLANNLGCTHHIVPIEPATNAFETMLQGVFAGKAPDVTEENIQARCRAVVLMAISNKLGNVLLNTSNKSEAAVGYGTLYGDLCGALSVLGDVYKTQVYELARYINCEQELIPANTLSKAPSAELRPGQKDSDSLPEYDILDKLVYQHLEEGKDFEELLAAGFDEALVRRTLQMLTNAEFKRQQVGPILKVSKRSFGTDRKVPIVAKQVL